MIEQFKEFCKEHGLKMPLIPRIYSDEQTLGDILFNLHGQTGRAIYQTGFDEGYAYQPKEDEK